MTLEPPRFPEREARTLSAGDTPTPPAEERPGGRVLAGRYELHQALGEGGMGVVWAATDRVLRRDVAIKLLPEAYGARPELRERLSREARAAARISSPHVAAVYDFGESDGRLFLVLEHVRGTSLRRALADGSTPSDVGGLARSLAEGLAAAHREGIVHRDFKPENVMLTATGAPKILDFGLAKEVEQDLDPLTRAGSVLGTPAYMAPEQARGEAVDARADVFAFGLVLYELLTGKRLLAGASVSELREAARSIDSRSISKAGVARGYERVLERCLAARPEDRFADATELLAALTAPPRRRASPGTKLVALCVGGAVLGAALVAGWKLRPGTSPASAPPGAPPTASASPPDRRTVGDGPFAHVSQQLLMARFGPEGWAIYPPAFDAPRPYLQSIGFTAQKGSELRNILVHRYDDQEAARKACAFFADVDGREHPAVKYAVRCQDRHMLAVGSVPGTGLDPPREWLEKMLERIAAPP